ncbi:MAG: ccpA [Planctomycetaceae bacterium]|nr:ccpA [Planctomycetaceae bacterium]
MQPENHESSFIRRLLLIVFVSLNVLDLLFTSHFAPNVSRAEESPRSKSVAETSNERSASKVDDLLKEAQRHFKPLPKDLATQEFPINPDLVTLGRKLFFDPRISADGTVSCSRCHQAALYGTDGLAKSHGAHDKVLPRNAPTVFNASLHFKQHWRGELQSVEEQAKRSLVGPGFANPDYVTAMTKLKAIPGYSEMFLKCFPGSANSVTEDNWGKAIGAYERTLVTPSRFDEFLNGTTNALTSAEQQGLRTFIGTGCALCHNGAGIGGDKFRKFGVLEDYWPATHSKDVDKGRFDLTKNLDDLYLFKVPGLRNVETTPPYFHDGSVTRLPDDVRIMARVQLDVTLSERDTTAIVTFLKSLTGKRPQDFTDAPILPAAGFDSSVTSTEDQHATR